MRERPGGVNQRINHGTEKYKSSGQRHWNDDLRHDRHVCQYAEPRVACDEYGCNEKHGHDEKGEQCRNEQQPDFGPEERVESRVSHERFPRNQRKLAAGERYRSPPSPARFHV